MFNIVLKIIQKYLLVLKLRTYVVVLKKIVTVN